MASQLRESLMNMLGEFVALKKSPDHKLSTTSNKFLAEAVRQEKNELNSFMDSLPKRSIVNPIDSHVRTNSLPSNAIRQRISSEPSIHKNNETQKQLESPKQKTDVEKKVVLKNEKKRKESSKNVLERLQKKERRHRKMSAPTRAITVVCESEESGAESEPALTSSLCIKIR